MAGHFADSSIQWPATTIYVIYDRRRLAMPLTPLYRAGHCLFSANSPGLATANLPSYRALSI
jgi:hypothetical protein